MLDHDKTQANASLTTDLDAVTKQLAALRTDMSRLAETVSGIAGRRGSQMAEDISDGFDEAKHYARSAGTSAEARIEGSVAAHPFLALGLAMGAGFVVGALSRR